MTDHIIVVRNPATGTVDAIMNEDGHIAKFPTEAYARGVASTHPLCRGLLYQIFALEDL
jgi:hypothetical protein